MERHQESGRQESESDARHAVAQPNKQFVWVNAEAVAVLEETLADRSMPKPSLYLHPVCSKQSSPPDAAQAGLYTHALAVLIVAPLAPCVIGHGAGFVSLRLAHGLLALYLHPVCSKQSSPPDAAHAGL
jgi:hypothetical protein